MHTSVECNQTLQPRPVRELRELNAFATHAMQSSFTACCNEFAHTSLGVKIPIAPQASECYKYHTNPMHGTHDIYIVILLFFDTLHHFDGDNG